MRSSLRRCAVLVALGSLLVAALAGGSIAAPRPATDAAPPLPLLDRVGMRPSSVTRIERGSWWGGPVVAATGETVTVYLSDAFALDESVRAKWANFFAWLDHGAELATLTAYIAPISQVQAICGSEAGGCYNPTSRVLVIPGDLGDGVGFDIAAHEYGHHIATSRRNDPWDPNGWGPKRWATYVGVCSRVASGRAFPGDEGLNYGLNTGEAFAEAYRALEEARGGYSWAHLPLVVDQSFAPDAGAEAAALADVQQPWTGPASATWEGRFSAPVVSLNASVGPSRTISLKTAAAAPARVLQAGTYAVSVRDRSAHDNFHLTGAGVDRKTGVPGRGRAVWTLALKPGVYRYRSDAHAGLGGSITVTARTATFAPLDRTLPTGLDGTFQAMVSGGANATLELLDAATGQVLAGPVQGAISTTICGQRSVLLRVAARQAGAFHVVVSTP
ncbi:MAG TPA: hypothetical protein VH816_08125 [Gaiellaceae bacterium]|jgi:hypothetical protein